MAPKSVTAAWMAGAFCAALGLAVLVLATRGAGVNGTVAALFVTARLSFLLFWPAYAGSATASLFGATFRPLQRRARECGLAFASAHLVHVGLVAWLCWIGATPSAATFAFFGVALVCTYALALFSFDRPRRMLTPGAWWVMRTLALNDIMLAFAVDFLRDPRHDDIRRVIEYWPFAGLVVAGPLLRLTAFLARLARHGRARGQATASLER